MKTERGSLDWMLEELRESVLGVRGVALGSEDGLLRAQTKGLDKDDADRIAALISGLHALSTGAAQRFFGDDRAESVLIQFAHGYMVVQGGRASGAVLVVLASAETDTVLLSGQMDALFVKLGEHLAALPRDAGSAVT